MLTLDNIRGYIASLGIAEDSNVYIGKLNGKKERDGSGRLRIQQL